MVSRAHFREFILEHPDFALHLIEKLIDRVRRATDNIKSLALSDVYGRLVQPARQTLAHECDGRQVVPERLTQQDIAERIGASRDMISRLMKDLVGGRLCRGRGPHHHDPPEAAAGLVAGALPRHGCASGCSRPSSPCRRGQA